MQNPRQKPKQTSRLNGFLNELAKCLMTIMFTIDTAALRNWVQENEPMKSIYKIVSSDGLTTWNGHELNTGCPLISVNVLAFFIRSKQVHYLLFTLNSHSNCFSGRSVGVKQHN